MIAYCHSTDTPFGLRDWAGVGMSDIACQLKQTFEKSLEHYWEPRLELLLPTIENLLHVPDEDQVFEEAMVPVSPETISAATQLACLLPRFGPLPEVSVDPDGEISFDWIAPSGNMFSVSVDGHGRLSYAGWFGEKSRVHGTEYLAESCPEEIRRGIWRATR